MTWSLACTFSSNEFFGMINIVEHRARTSRIRIGTDESGAEMLYRSKRALEFCAALVSVSRAVNSGAHALWRFMAVADITVMFRMRPISIRDVRLAGPYGSPNTAMIASYSRNKLPKSDGDGVDSNQQD